MELGHALVEFSTELCHLLSEFDGILQESRSGSTSVRNLVTSCPRPVKCSASLVTSALRLSTSSRSSPSFWRLTCEMSAQAPPGH